MLDLRQQNIILELLKAHDYITIRELSSKNNVSPRTIRYELNKIDDFLKRNGLDCIEKKIGKGIRYSNKKVLNLIGETNKNNILEPKERAIRIIVKLLGRTDFITMEELAGELDVSKSTIKKDLEMIRSELPKETLELVSGRGIRLIGNEYRIRTDCIQEILSKKSNELEVLYRLFGKDFMEKIRNAINLCENYLPYGFNDIQYNNLMLHLALVMKRILLGRSIVIEDDYFTRFTTMPEFPMVASLCQNLSRLFNIPIPESEIYYISLHFMASHINENIKDGDLEIGKFTSSFIYKISDKYGFDFTDDKVLYTSLCQHFQGLIYRGNKNIFLDNPILKTIKEKNNKLYDIVYAEKSIFDSITGVLSHDEIGFIVLHFLTSLKKYDDKLKRKCRILVSCNSGLATSNWILEQLKNKFVFEELGVCSFYEIDNYVKKHEVDLLITTMPYHSDYTKTIVVNLNLTQKNLEEISLYLLNYNTKSDGQSLKDVISIIEKHCPVDKFPDLYREINTLYPTILRQYKSLKDFISLDSIYLKDYEKNFKDTMLHWGQKLLDNGILTFDYLDKLIDEVSNYGSYMVLAPYIAMPHIYIEGAIKETTIGIIKLENPILFGEKGDLIKLMFVLITKDRTEHRYALQDIINIVNKKKIVDYMMEINNTVDMFDFLSKNRV